MKSKSRCLQGFVLLEALLENLSLPLLLLVGCGCFLAVTANPTSASVFTWMFTLVSFLRTLVSASRNLIRQIDPVL